MIVGMDDRCWVVVRNMRWKVSEIKEEVVSKSDKEICEDDNL